MVLFRYSIFLFGFFLSLVSPVMSQELTPIESLYVLDQDDMIQVAFGFNYELIDNTSEFYIETLLDDQVIIEKSCSYLFDDISGLYGKITCPIESRGNGNYEFRGILDIQGEKVFVTNSRLAIFENISSSFTFKEVENGTQITLHIGGSGENVQILSRIPKEVIELLTPENQDSLISSELPYEIIEADPLIAWNVEKIPTDVSYTIKKNISIENRNNFAVEIRESEETHVLTYLIFILLLIVLFFVFKPMFKK